MKRSRFSSNQCVKIPLLLCRLFAIEYGQVLALNNFVWMTLTLYVIGSFVPNTHWKIHYIFTIVWWFERQWSGLECVLMFPAGWWLYLSPEYFLVNLFLFHPSCGHQLVIRSPNICTQQCFTDLESQPITLNSKK